MKERHLKSQIYRIAYCRQYVYIPVDNVFRFINSTEALQIRNINACSRIDRESGCAAESVVEFSHQISEMVFIGEHRKQISRGKTGQYFDMFLDSVTCKYGKIQIKITLMVTCMKPHLSLLEPTPETDKNDGSD